MLSRLLFAGALLSATTLLAQPDVTIPSEEREALVAIYRSTGGESWKNREGWLGPAGSECNWHGVSCSNGHVTWLQLYENNLTRSAIRAFRVPTRRSPIIESFREHRWR